tara:strand:+ start:146 stop:319 length:174 start_codon:yes stop_codon:yes gene_type:complete
MGDRGIVKKTAQKYYENEKDFYEMTIRCTRTQRLMRGIYKIKERKIYISPYRYKLES